MNLEEHYNKLYNESIKKIMDDTYEVDGLINSPLDKRFGITLLARPSKKIKNNIQKFLNDIKTVEPYQYYYNDSDIHITVMSIISCYEGFQLKSINISEYIDLISKSLINHPNIEITFRGISASPSCIMVQGFMNNNFLNLIRNNLRENFKNSNLQQSLDKRYPIQTAHTTVIRFQKEFSNKPEFLRLIDTFRNYNFGSFQVKKLELVFNDWYQKESLVKKLYEFSIQN